jgi:phage terminase large subunit
MARKNVPQERHELQSVVERIKKSFARWRQDPVVFVQEALNANPWEKQEEVLRALAAHRRVCFVSCHGVGKTKTAAWAVLWFLYCHPGAKVITTAPTWHQVEHQLWREIRAEFAKLSENLAPVKVGQCFTTRLELAPDWFAVGLSTNEPERFQGFHAEQLLVVIDEAGGVSSSIFAAAESYMTSAHTKMLLVGNPTQPGTELHKAFLSPDYYKVQVSAFDTPNLRAGNVVRPYLVTPAWVEERRREWGEDSALFQMRVLGQFPSASVDSVITPAMLAAARVAPNTRRGTRVIAADIARFGDDRTVVLVLDGTEVAECHVLVGKDTMYTAAFIHILAQRYKPDAIAIDGTGVGAGVVDRLREMGNEVLEVNSAERASEPEQFANLRAEMWWKAREMFAQGLVSLNADDELSLELTTPIYFLRLGRIQVESKDDIKRRLGRSPDKADAYVIGLHALRQLATLHRMRRA